MTDRDRYQNHTYTESRDRGRAEHAAQDEADEWSWDEHDGYRNN